MNLPSHLFLLIKIETYSAVTKCQYSLTLFIIYYGYAAKCVQLRCFRSGLTSFTWTGSSPINHLWPQKTRDTGLPNDKDRIPLRSLVWHNTWLWRTDLPQHKRNSAVTRKPTVKDKCHVQNSDVSVKARPNDKVQVSQPDADQHQHFQQQQPIPGRTVPIRVGIDCLCPQSGSRLGIDLVAILYPRRQSAAGHLTMVLDNAGNLRPGNAGQNATHARHKHVLHRQERRIDRHRQDSGGCRARNDVPRSGAVGRIVPVRVHGMWDVKLRRDCAVRHYCEAMAADEAVGFDAEKVVDKALWNVEAVVIGLENEPCAWTELANPTKTGHRLVR